MATSVMLQKLGEGMVTSLWIFAVTLIFSLPLGLLISFGRMSKNKIISTIFKLYISVMRGTPLMLQLVVVYFAPYYLFGVSLGSLFGGNYRLIAVLIGFIINYAAYFAEIFRGGIQSIPRGQYEAAQVLGLSHRQCFFKIIVPQVIKRVIPPMGNEFVTLVKDTALVYAVAINDITRIAKTIMMNQNDMLAFVVAGVYYLILTSLVTFLFNWFEKKLSYYKI